MRRRPAVVSLAAVLALGIALGVGCAHYKPTATLASLRTASDTFFRYLRWNDLRGASQMLVIESQRDWLEKALDGKDDEILKVTDCEPDDLKTRPGEATGEVKVTWHRLPSVTTQTDRVIVEWVDREGSWFIASIKNGPLPLDPPPQADAGTPPPGPAEQAPAPRAL